MKTSTSLRADLALGLLTLIATNVNAQTVYTISATPTQAISVPFRGSSFNFVNPTGVDSGGRAYTSATALATLLNGESDFLEVDGFGFSVPTNAVIQGVQVKVDREADGINLLTSVTDDQVYLLSNGATIGANMATSSRWTGTETWQNYGSPTNLWAAGLTPAQVNSSNFGVALSVDIAGVASLIPSAKVYNVQVVLSYTTPSIILPVSLAAFNLQLVDEGISLQWQVTDITNGTRYLLERSPDSDIFSEVDSNSYTGDERDVLTYSYIDRSPLPGRSYYRLQIVASDGTKTYSDVLTFDNQVAQASASAYPNPAHQTIIVTGIQAENLAVLSVAGCQMKCPVSKISGGLQLDLSAFPSGIYYARSGRTTVKFVHQ